MNNAIWLVPVLFLIISLIFFPISFRLRFEYKNKKRMLDDAMELTATVIDNIKDLTSPNSDFPAVMYIPVYMYQSDIIELDNPNVRYTGTVSYNKPRRIGSKWKLYLAKDGTVVELDKIKTLKILSAAFIASSITTFCASIISALLIILV